MAWAVWVSESEPSVGWGGVGAVGVTTQNLQWKQSIWFLIQKAVQVLRRIHWFINELSTEHAMLSQSHAILLFSRYIARYPPYLLIFFVCLVPTGPPPSLHFIFPLLPPIFQSSSKATPYRSFSHIPLQAYHHRAHNFLMLTYNKMQFYK